MKDYKNTLHLPETTFAMKAELAKREPEMLKQWQTEKLYQKIQDARKDAPKFILHDGPPYANGDIHVGHAVNKILKDMIVKAKVLSGHQAPYVPGWDCHGLPIELQVEKKFGKVGAKISAAEFRKHCRDYALSQIDKQREDFKRLGVLADWDHRYATLDNSYEADIIRTLAKIYQHDYITKGYKPIHWCLDCGSSLAEAEVEYQDKTSDAITVKFEIDPESVNLGGLIHKFKSEEKAFILIWTTTPWTLPANRAVCAGSDIIYSCVKYDNNYYFVAKNLLEKVFNQKEFQPINLEMTGAQLSDAMKTQGYAPSILSPLKHPFNKAKIPFILGDHVTTDTGTGFVHTAPAHGLEDYLVAQKYKDIFNDLWWSPLQSNGCFAANEQPELANVHISKANPIIIKLLKENDTLFNDEKIIHSFPHCWRHKTPLIFRATPQWFISMEHLLPKADQAAQTVAFFPSEGKNRFISMLEGRPDWCISRQRYWGVPIPFFVNKQTGELHPQTFELMMEAAKRIETEGLEAWFSASCEDYKVSSHEYDKANDTLDVWFESGSSSECVLKNHKQFPSLSFPADLYLEGSDQHRAWFQSSLLTAIAANGETPYRQILTHGFVVDGEGRKMSKSIGNIITPQEVMNQYGADILRLWVAMSDYRNEISISPTILQQTADLYRKLRNTLRFLLANLNNFKPEQLLPLEQTTELDQLMVNKALTLQEAAQDYLNNYQISAYIKALNLFCENDLSNCYFDVIKDRQYTSQARRLSQTALYHILHILVRIMSPVLSFTSDEAWRLMHTQNLVTTKDPETIFTATWYDAIKPSHVKHLDENLFIELKIMRANINKILDVMRKNKEVGGNLDVEIELYSKHATKLKALEPELKFFFIASSFQIKDMSDAPNTAQTLENLDTQVIIKKSEQKKCDRCWHHTPDVSQKDPKYGEQQICNRCYDNVYGQGELRKYF